ncbi:MAG: ATP-binding protein [Ktedonobacteraceae bacterium]
MSASPPFPDETKLAFDRQILAALESINDGFIVLDTCWCYTYLNRAAETMLQKKREDLLGKNIWEINPEAVGTTFWEKYHEAADAQTMVEFEDFYPPFGKWFHVRVYPSEAGLAVYFQIITEHKQLQQHLHFLFHASKALSSSLDYKMTLQTIANLAVPHIADWCTIDMLAEDGSIEQLVIAHADPQRVAWAREVRKKYPLDRNANRGIPHVLRTGTSEIAPVISDDMLVATAVDSEQLRLLRNIGFTSGMTIPFIIEGKAIGTVTFALAGAGRHYTQADLAMAEELAARASLAIHNARLYRAVQQSRDQLDIILQGVADGIIVYDKDSHIIYANEAAARMTGFASVQAMLETPPTGIAARYELIDEQRQPFSHSRFTHARVLAGERDAQAIIGYKNTATGQPERWSLVKSRPVFDERGEVTMVVTIVHDITERILAEQRKDEFISMTSHELKTPVTSLKGFTNVLQRRLTKQGDEQGLHYLNRMDTQLNKLTKLISDLLDISRMQTGKLAFQIEAFDLDTLIHETVENVQAATTTHQLLIEGRTSAQVLGDKDRLGQVFINLLTNAVKYSPQANKVLVRLSRDQGQVIVSVQDFGVGIDQAHHQKIFERFYQVTDPKEATYPGLGIGLYISREIVERHHGSLEVESRKGEGATFSVALPLLQLSP